MIVKVDGRLTDSSTYELAATATNEHENEADRTVAQCRADGRALFRGALSQPPGDTASA